MKKPLVLHPLLFAAFSVLSLLAQNLDWIPLSDAARPLILSTIGAAALLGVIWLIIRDLPRAGLVTTLVLLIFFSYGHLYAALKEAGLGATVARHRYVAPTAAVLAFGGSIWVLRVLKDPKPLTGILNLLSAGLLLIPVVSIVGQGIGSSSLPPQETSELSLSIGQEAPDIYYIVVDGYARQDTLNEVYDLNNEPFLRSLEDLGFYIARSARANYAQTSLALASALNMEYVEDLVPEHQQGRATLWNLIQRSQVRGQLEDLGYETVAFATGLEGTEWRDADVFWSPSVVRGISAFESMLAQTTAIRMATEGAVALPHLIPAFDYPYEAHRTRLLHALDGLASLPPSDKPRLVFAHLILPHPPFVFDAEGRPLTPDTPFSLDVPSGTSAKSYIDGYRNQVMFLNREILEIVETILEESGSPPVIVIQADHGPDSNSGQQDYVQERMTILNALLMPGGYEAVYPHITPVNTFRLIFNQLFGGEYERLPDRALFSSYEAPYELIDVTGGVHPP